MSNFFSHHRARPKFIEEKPPIFPKYSYFKDVERCRSTVQNAWFFATVAIFLYGFCSCGFWVMFKPMNRAPVDQTNKLNGFEFYLYGCCLVGVWLLILLCVIFRRDKIRTLAKGVNESSFSIGTVLGGAGDA